MFYEEYLQSVLCKKNNRVPTSLYIKIPLRVFLRLGVKESNLHIQIQSLLSCH